MYNINVSILVPYKHHYIRAQVIARGVLRGDLELS